MAAARKRKDAQRTAKAVCGGAEPSVAKALICVATNGKGMAWRSLAKEKKRRVSLSEEIEELCNGIGQLCVDTLWSSTEVYCGARAMQRREKQGKGIAGAGQSVDMRSKAMAKRRIVRQRQKSKDNRNHSGPHPNVQKTFAAFGTIKSERTETDELPQSV